MEFEIDFVSPCEEVDILTIIAPDEIPVDYTVDYFMTELRYFELPKFEVNPEICELIYFLKVTPADFGLDGIYLDENQ